MARLNNQRVFIIAVVARWWTFHHTCRSHPPASAQPLEYHPVWQIHLARENQKLSFNFGSFNSVAPHPNAFFVFGQPVSFVDSWKRSLFPWSMNWSIRWVLVCWCTFKKATCRNLYSYPKKPMVDLLFCPTKRFFNRLVVWNMCYFPEYMECHPSHWRTHIFQDGYCTTNQFYMA